MLFLYASTTHNLPKIQAKKKPYLNREIELTVLTRELPSNHRTVSRSIIAYFSICLILFSYNRGIN